MKKLLWIFLPVMLLISGCDNVYVENVSVHKHAKDKKYFEKLKTDNVKFLKCYPNKDGKGMVARYTTVARDNDFPATIRFNYVGDDVFNLYFDNAYLNAPKEELLVDVDACFAEWEKMKKAHKTWK